MPTLGTKEELQAIRKNGAEVLIKMEYPDEMGEADDVLPAPSLDEEQSVPKWSRPTDDEGAQK